MKIREWAAFCFLGTVWGSSFLWIKIGLGEIKPITLMAYSFLIGVIGLFIIMRLTHQSFPRDRNTTLGYLFMAVFNAAIPFALTSWGETKISSGLAAILNATVPLFTIVIAHSWLHDEKINSFRIAGLVTGILGITILVERNLGFGGSTQGQIALLLAAASYGTAITFSRKHLRGKPPVVEAMMMILIADILLWFIAFALEGPLVVPLRPATWAAIMFMGAIGSSLAYVLYFYLIETRGAIRTSLVNYVYPVVGLTLGVLILGEIAYWQLLVGSVLVVAGVILVNITGLDSRSHAG
jgi:drug/metabolite transporter (DMT)-like permease